MKKTVVILHVYGYGSIFLIFYDYMTLNLINEKWEMVWLDQYSHRKIPKDL